MSNIMLIDIMTGNNVKIYSSQSSFYRHSTSFEKIFTPSNKRHLSSLLLCIKCNKNASLYVPSSSVYDVMIAHL